MHCVNRAPSQLLILLAYNRFAQNNSCARSDRINPNSVYILSLYNGSPVKTSGENFFVNIGALR